MHSLLRATDRAPGRPLTARPRVLALLALVVSANSCAPESHTLAPVQRFATEFADPDTTTPARASIEADLRPVLQAYPPTQLASLQLPPKAERSGPIQLPLPPALHDAEQLVLRPFVKRRNTGGYYQPQSAWLAPVRGAAATRWVALDAALPPEPLDVYVEARVPPSETTRRLESRPLEIPAGARLDFSIGVLEAAWDQGPASFEVLACAADDACEPLYAEMIDPRASARGSWRPRSVPLDALAGTRRSFRFETRFERAAESSFSFPVWGDPTLLAPREAGDEERSLILISIDTLGAKHLGAYGYTRQTAPFIAELAAEGCVFDNVVAAATTTAPSHMTLFTSLQPSVHAVRGNAAGTRLPASAPTLAERLRDQGFATAAITEGGGIRPRRGFERGFASYVENPTRIPHEPGTQSALTLPRALDWIRNLGQRRFFLFVHTYEVHGPYLPPQAYESLFTDASQGRPEPPGAQRALRYDREIRYVDDELRRFVAGLDELGRLRDTLLVVTSDHGEEFMEHGGVGHGAAPYQEVLHVPLVFQGPGVPGGRRIQEPVGLVDLMPTLLDLLGLPLPPGLTGRSFARFVSGETPGSGWRQRPLFSEAWFRYRQTPSGRRPVEQPTLAVRLGDRKLIRFREAGGFRYELYHLASDPGEQQDLYAEHAGASADLRELLDAYESSAAAQREALLQSDEPEGLELDPDRQQSLRALGYIE